MTKKKVSAILITVLTLLILTSSIPPARAQFVLSSWDFPDEYGQGIEGFELYENSTGSWVQVGDYVPYDEPTVFDWDVGVGIKLIFYTWFNSTLTGATSGANGKNFQRHNVTVFDVSSTLIFSQQNFTYVAVDTGIDPPLWLYSYFVILDFLPEIGEYYTVSVIYEVAW